jgi:hypothetical protein
MHHETRWGKQPREQPARQTVCVDFLDEGFYFELADTGIAKQFS